MVVVVRLVRLRRGFGPPAAAAAADVDGDLRLSSKA